MNSLTGIELQVVQDIAERQQKGISTYGTTVAENPLTQAQWIQHAYEEALDLAIPQTSENNSGHCAALSIQPYPWT